MAGYMDIRIDESKCTTPFDCKQCLNVCKSAVFQVRPAKMERGRETDKREPGSYKLSAVFFDKCTGCMDCVQVCPADALRVKYTETGA